MTRLAAMVLLLLLLLGCTRDAVPERPKNVPLSAVWSGGPDGGDWFNCSSQEGDAFNHCTVYADVTGAVVETGKYQLKDEHRAARKDELHFAYHSKGEIFLRNNKVLVRVGPEG